MSSNITEDSSTPTAQLFYAATGGVGSGTSPSFSPPANSLLVVCASWSGGSSLVPTVSDSAGSTYSHPVHIASGSFNSTCGADIWLTYFNTAPGSITVTVNWSGGGGHAPAMAFLGPLVLNHTNSNQTGANSGTSQSSISGSTSSEVTFTPADSGSWVVLVTGTGQVSIPTPGTVSNFTSIQWVNDATGPAAAGYGANETGPSGSTTYGFTFGSNNPVNASGALEIIQGSASPVNVDLTTGQINVSGPNPQPTVGHAVPLTTGQVNVSGPAPTITATRITSGGQGAPGFIKLTYISPQVETLTSSLSPVATTDVFGNVVPAGYMGPISAILPGSSPVEPETWHSLVLTNASASGNGVNGLFYRYRSNNSVELVWDITLSTSAATIATLPSLYTPQSVQNLQSSWYGTGPATYNDTFSPALQISAAGAISVQNCDALAISLCGEAYIPLDI
jgi:hypothetical protein